VFPPERAESELFRKQKICAVPLLLILDAVNLGLAAEPNSVSKENQVMLKKLAALAILAASMAVLNAPAQTIPPPHCNPGAPNCVAINR
jgi:hypothetical protein